MPSFIKEHSGIIISFLIIPLLYAIGYLYDAGYLSAYDLSTTMFEHSINYYFMNSFTAFMYLLVYLFQHIHLYLIVIIGICFLTTTLAFIHFRFPSILSENDLELKGLIQRLKRIKNQTIRSAAIAITAGVTYFLLIMLGIYFLFCIVTLPIIAYKAGQSNAKQEIEKYQPCDKNNPRKGCAFIYDGKELIASGHIIASNEQFVAVFDGTQTKAIPIESKEINIAVK